MRSGAVLVLATAGLVGATLIDALPRARADGAVAVGSTGNIVRDGIAFGMVVNEPKEKAAETAVSRCRTFQARAAAERCKVVATFAGECFAVAYDPKPGTPGAGWGVGPDQLAANQNAIAMCEQTAGPARKGYCRVESGGCDTTGQREMAAPVPQAPSQSVPPAPTKPESKAPRKTDTKEATAVSPDRGVSATPAEVLATPVVPETPTKAPDRVRKPTPAKGSPWLLVGVMAGVGLAYGLGQLLKGKLQSGLSEAQIVVGGTIAIAAGVIAKLLDMAGVEQLVIMTLAGLIALAAAVLV